MSGFEIERSPHVSTYSFYPADLDELKLRVDDLYAVGATGKERIDTMTTGKIEVRIASSDLWPKQRHEPPRSYQIRPGPLALLIVGNVMGAVWFVLMLIS